MNGVQLLSIKTYSRELAEFLSGKEVSEKGVLLILRLLKQHYPVDIIKQFASNEKCLSYLCRVEKDKLPSMELAGKIMKLNTENKQHRGLVLVTSDLDCNLDFLLEHYTKISYNNVSTFKSFTSEDFVHFLELYYSDEVRPKNYVGECYRAFKEDNNLEWLLEHKYIASLPQPRITVELVKRYPDKVLTLKQLIQKSHQTVPMESTSFANILSILYPDKHNIGSVKSLNIMRKHAGLAYLIYEMRCLIDGEADLGKIEQFLQNIPLISSEDTTLLNLAGACYLQEGDYITNYLDLNLNIETLHETLLGTYSSAKCRELLDKYKPLLADGTGLDSFFNFINYEEVE